MSTVKYHLKIKYSQNNYIGPISKNIFSKIFLISFLFLYFLSFNNSTLSSPTGKGLSCVADDNQTFSSYEKFRGLYFESDKSVRVVIFKNTNNSLKIISKLTPYKISNNDIKFKIKFIWYGNISFEDFVLNRQTLKLNHESTNLLNKLHCKILNGDFMNKMNDIKFKFQINFDKKLKSNKI